MRGTRPCIPRGSPCLAMVRLTCRTESQCDGFVDEWTRSTCHSFHLLCAAYTRRTVHHGSKRKGKKTVEEVPSAKHQGTAYASTSSTARDGRKPAQYPPACQISRTQWLSPTRVLVAESVVGILFLLRLQHGMSAVDSIVVAMLPDQPVTHLDQVVSRTPFQNLFLRCEDESLGRSGCGAID